MRRSGRVTWPEVLRVVQGDENRFAVATAIRTSGFSADSFATRIEARRSVCEALVGVEDRLELRRGVRGLTERLAVRAVRRRLECELWP